MPVKATPKVWAPKAQGHTGRCITFRSYPAGHECVECGKWYPPDAVDAQIAKGMEETRDRRHDPRDRQDRAGKGARRGAATGE